MEQASELIRRTVTICRIVRVQVEIILATPAAGILIICVPEVQHLLQRVMDESDLIIAHYGNM